MKLLYLLLPAVLLNACSSSSRVDFTGKAPGITHGLFSVKDGNNTLCDDAIKTGTFKATAMLEHPGYYTLNIMDNDHMDKEHEPYEVYLEPGTYQVETVDGDLKKYPKITSTSKNQQDLSDYYAIYDRSVSAANNLVAELEAKLHGKTPPTEQEYLLFGARLVDAQSRKQKVNLDAFRTFVNDHPNSAINAHLMATLSYENDPVAYNSIYQKFSAAAKNTPEGQEIGEKLNTLLKLVPGSAAPEIFGATPDGKKFDKKALNKQVYVIDFWRAGNEISRLNHQDFVNNMVQQMDMKKAGIISISLDSKRDWWTTAIKDDHLTWPQYSDLKGNESANAAAWLITTMPTYYLVDSNWKILQRDIPFSKIVFEVQDYLKKLHRNHTVLQYSKNMIGGQVPYSYAAGKFAK
ncbi:hypothetical protein [Mucilaginibacter koreensis]